MSSHINPDSLTNEGALLVTYKSPAEQKIMAKAEKAAEKALEESRKAPHKAAVKAQKAAARVEKSKVYSLGDGKGPIYSRKERDNVVVNSFAIVPDPGKFFTPPRNVKRMNKRLNALDALNPRERFKSRAAIGVAAVVDIAFLVPMVHGLITVDMGLLTAAMLGLPVLIGVMIPCGIELHRGAYPFEQLNILHRQAFQKWMYERYGLTIINHDSDQLVKVAVDGLDSFKGAMGFRAYDGNDYMLVDDGHGNLLVKTIDGNEAPIVEPAAAAAAELDVEEQENVVLTETDALLADVLKLAGKLDDVKLTAEQEYVVERSVREARNVIGAWKVMQSLREDASDVDVVHVLNASVDAMRSVVDDVYSMLAEETHIGTRVVAMRDDGILIR